MYTELYIIFPAVVYRYKNWSLTEKEENGLRVFENGVLWKTFGLKREEVRRH